MNRPEPTADHIRTWRALIAACEAGADNIRAPMGDLQKIAIKARKAVVPGALVASSPFVQLQRMAERFVGETKSGRLQLAAELAALAAVCARALADLAPAKSGGRKYFSGDGRRFWMEAED